MLGDQIDIKMSSMYSKDVKEQAKKNQTNPQTEKEEGKYPGWTRKPPPAPTIVPGPKHPIAPADGSCIYL